MPSLPCPRRAGLLGAVPWRFVALLGSDLRHFSLAMTYFAYLRRRVAANRRALPLLCHGRRRTAQPWLICARLNRAAAVLNNVTRNLAIAPQNFVVPPRRPAAPGSPPRLTALAGPKPEDYSSGSSS